MTLQDDQTAIANAEAALTALGPLSASNFDQAFAQLVIRHNAQQDIKKYQNNQFYPDAFNIMNQMQNVASTSDKVVLISQYLRAYAEYIATQTQTLEKTYTTVKSIVDNISPMSSQATG